MCHLINDVIYRVKQLYKCYCQIGTCIYCTIWIVMYRFWKVSSRHLNKHWFELLTARNAVVAPCMSNLRAFRRNCWRHDRAYIWATSLFLSHSSTHIPFCFLLSTPRQFSMFISHYAISYVPHLCSFYYPTVTRQTSLFNCQWHIFESLVFGSLSSSF